MRLYLFRVVRGSHYALSADPGGRNIPRQLGAGVWSFVRPIELLPCELRSDFDAAGVAAAVKEDGYALIGCPFHFD